MLGDDDDTGYREGGRELFQKELLRASEELGMAPLRCVSVQTTVCQKEFGWVAKPATVIHYNVPEGVKL